MVRVLFVWGTMTIGGAETAALELAKALKKKGHYVAILSEGGPLVRDLTAFGIPHYYGKVDTKNPLAMVMASKLVDRITQRDRIEVYYCDGLAQSVMAYFAGRRAFRRTGRRPGVITVVHGHERAFYYYISSPLYNLLSDHVTAICEFDRKRLLDHGLSPDHVSTIYNALPLDNLPFPISDDLYIHRELAIDQNQLLVGYIGRLSPEKDVGTLIRAIPEVVAKHPQTAFVIVGDGPEKEALVQLAEKLHVSKFIHFLGYRRDIPPILHSISLSVLSSTREVFPMIILESFYYQRPVVSTDVGGVSELVVDGKTGYKVAPKDHQQLAERILEILQQTDLRKKMGESARRLVLDHFDLENTTSQLAGILGEFSLPSSLGGRDGNGL